MYFGVAHPILRPPAAAQLSASTLMVKLTGLTNEEEYVCVVGLVTDIGTELASEPSPGTPRYGTVMPTAVNPTAGIEQRTDENVFMRCAVQPLHPSQRPARGPPAAGAPTREIRVACILPLPQRMKAVHAMQLYHQYALRCRYGALGFNSSVASLMPANALGMAQSPGLAKPVAVQSAVCGLDGSGAAYCWGSNS